MSLWVQELMECPACHTSTVGSVARSINLRQHPEVAAQLAAEQLSKLRCASCKTVFRWSHELVLTDGTHWILLLAPHRRHQPASWLGMPARVAELVAGHAPAVSPATSPANSVSVRVVFCHADLSEAVRTLACGLDPRVLECVKLGARADVPAPMPGALLLFEDYKDGKLELSWRSPDGERTLRQLVVPERALTYVEQHLALYQRAMPALFSSPYISLRALDCSAPAAAHREPTPAAR